MQPTKEFRQCHENEGDLGIGGTKDEGIQGKESLTETLSTGFLCRPCAPEGFSRQIAIYRMRLARLGHRWTCRTSLHNLGFPVVAFEDSSPRQGTLGRSGTSWHALYCNPTALKWDSVGVVFCCSWQMLAPPLTSTMASLVTRLASPGPGFSC